MNNIKPIPSFDLPILGHRVSEPFEHSLGEWCPKEAVRQLEQDAERMARALLDMLIEGECYYNLLPNSHRMSALEYYSDEIKTVEKITGKKFLYST